MQLYWPSCARTQNYYEIMIGDWSNKNVLDMLIVHDVQFCTA